MILQIDLLICRSFFQLIFFLFCVSIFVDMNIFYMFSTPCTSHHLFTLPILTWCAWDALISSLQYFSRMLYSIFFHFFDFLVFSLSRFFNFSCFPANDFRTCERHRNHDCWNDIVHSKSYTDGNSIWEKTNTIARG